MGADSLAQTGMHSRIKSRLGVAQGRREIKMKITGIMDLLNPVTAVSILDGIKQVALSYN
jgi:hypothetical protein